MAQAPQAGNRFGEIAVREGFASRQQVQECLDIQTKLKSFGVEPKRLGEIMVEKGYLRDGDVKAILDVQRLGGSRMESRSGVISDVGAGLLARKARPHLTSSVTGDVPAIKNIPGYEVLELLGEGGMGMVYKARQKSLDRIVALKVLPARAAKETAFIKRFISEARTVARLNHENIIAGIDVGEHDGTYYFAMEHVEGESVAQLIERQGALEERFALQVVAQMARALAHAHKHNLVHRDVKPQNILVTKSGLAKLCDLGLAKMQNEASKDPQGVPVGTPHYLSPEQARGEADVDIRSDIYSLGASLYHMLTGSTPFEGQSPMVLMTKHLTEEPSSPRRTNPNVSKGASDLVLRMMAKDKEDRHQTPGELLEDVERVLAGKKAAPPPPRSGRRRRKQSGPHRAADSQEPEPTASARTPSAEREVVSRRPRPRMRFVRGGGSDVLWMIAIPVFVLVMVGGAVFIFSTTSLPPPVEPPRVSSDPEADALFKAARARQRTDPEGARASYQEIVRRWPGSHEAKLATEYLAEMDR
ncbi:MAG: protein kinase [Planctomycetes bacterium]|nr:protein kinase [Planctomycetota bacterium]